LRPAEQRLEVATGARDVSKLLMQGRTGEFEGIYDRTRGFRLWARAVAGESEEPVWLPLTWVSA
jgi:hypothetical protein